MSDLPRRLLRLEGLAVLGGAVSLYFHLGYGWILLVVLALARHLSVIGYGYGSKYPTGVEDTHLQRV